MDAYIYQAALVCEDCYATLDELEQRSADGPWVDGGGEADTPQHCDHCGEFLENPLTDDGREYVVERLNEHSLTGRGNKDVLDEWRRFYDLKRTVDDEDPPNNWDRDDDESEINGALLEQEERCNATW